MSTTATLPLKTGETSASSKQPLPPSPTPKKTLFGWFDERPTTPAEIKLAREEYNKMLDEHYPHGIPLQ